MFTLHWGNNILPYFRNWVSIHFLCFQVPKPLWISKDGKRSPCSKTLERERGMGVIKDPLERKVLGGGGGANQRVFRGDGHFLEPHNAHHCFCVVVALIGLYKEWMHQHPSCFRSQPMAKFDGILIEILLGTKQVEHLRVMFTWCVFPTWRNPLFNLI